MQLTTSFDVQRSTLPPIEIYGTAGTMLVPDPNGFGAGPSGAPEPIALFQKARNSWDSVPLSHQYSENSRGLGVFDQVRAIQNNLAPRASGEVGLHVLEAMESILKSGLTGERMRMTTIVERPVAMPIR